MKAYNFFAIALLGITAFVGCTKDVGTESGLKQRELALSPSTVEMQTTRSSGATFFVNGDQIDLVINDEAGNHNYTYAYTNGAFRGINPANTYHFFMDDQMINTITATWPTLRPATRITDQRLDLDFKMSDYMTATLQNVMVAKEYVPIAFVHENAKVSFGVTGQNANGLKIESLVVDIDNKAYWAHLDPVTGRGEIIIPPGNVELNAGEIAGRITVNGVTGSMIFQTTQTYTLVANTSYIVTLSPSGDNVFASISIGGWYQDENGVSVPLIQQNGYYMIGSEAQLFAIASLINNYKPDGGNVDWAAAKYMLSGDITRSPTPLRPWNTLTNFAGEFNLNGHTISPTIIFASSGTIIQ